MYKVWVGWVVVVVEDGGGMRRVSFPRVPWWHYVSQKIPRVLLSVAREIFNILTWVLYGGCLWAVFKAALLLQQQRGGKQQKQQ